MLLGVFDLGIDPMYPTTNFQKMAAKRFTKKDKEFFLADNWKEVQRRWRSDFNENMQPHYICECCGFISANRDDFDVDHVIPIARGGTRNRYQNARTTEWPGEETSKDYPDHATILKEGQNAQILCKGCNLGKLSKYFVPDGKGYAYTEHDRDLNPDNL
jgi:5-methylcytosine-specific restriction endonuclease McrA